MEERDHEYTDQRKSIKGYQIVIVILALILAALSYLYYSQTTQLKSDFSIERDTLTQSIGRLMSDIDNIRTENDTISRSLNVERGKADSLMQRLRRERNLSAGKIREYEKELGTLRQVMRGFVTQLDSLNKLNHKLIDENIGYRKDIATERLGREKAEEKASEMEVKIRKGSVVNARGINLLALNAGDREVSRASRAARMRVDFTLSANELAVPGPRNVYVRITGPDGYVLANAGNDTFSFEGDRITYSAFREIDYQGQDLGASIYYTGGGITSGKYLVVIYMDGQRIGSSEIILK